MLLLLFAVIVPVVAAIVVVAVVFAVVAVIVAVVVAVAVLEKSNLLRGRESSVTAATTTSPTSITT